MSFILMIQLNQLRFRAENLALRETGWYLTSVQMLYTIGNHFLCQGRGQILCIYDPLPTPVPHFECISIVVMVLPNIICRVPN